MTDLDDRLRADFQRLSARFSGEREPASWLLAAVRRRRRRRAATLSAATAAAVATAVTATLVGVATVTGASRPAPQPTAPATSPTGQPTGAPPPPQPGLPADQFVGLLRSAGSPPQLPYAWTFSLGTGKPVRQLVATSRVVGLSGDRRWALVDQQQTVRNCYSVSSSALVSVSTGQVVQPWPAGYEIAGSGIGGQTAVALAYPPSDETCPQRVLLTYDLTHRELHRYDLPRLPGDWIRDIAAVSPDGRSVVVENRLFSQHLLFGLVHINPGKPAVTVTDVPAAPPGCSPTAYSLRPSTAVLSANATCGQTLRITGYDPTTLQPVDHTTLTAPAGPTITVFNPQWNRTGTQALIEDFSRPAAAPQTLWLLRNGHLHPAVTTNAYNITW